MTREHEIRGDIARMPVDSDVEVSPRPLPHPWTLVRHNADLLPVIAVGGALGSLARWGLATALPHDSGSYAWSTFLANVSGALLLGVLMALVLDVWAERRYVRPFLGVGVLGGYTTFSTYLLDERGIVAAGRPGVALGYLLLTLVAGFTATAAGLAGVRGLLDRRRSDAEVETVDGAAGEEARR